ncbi:SMR family transporter [Rubidibacter lacunae]|nr:SMR family transporter [Rubidibacter lacunae]
MKDDPTTVSLLLYFLLLLAAVGCNSIGQTLLKLGSGQSVLNPYIASGLLAYSIGTISYIALLSKLNLSVAYPVVIGLTIIMTTLSGTMFLHEKVAPGHWLGIGLMLSGILAITSAGWRQ